MEPREQQWSLRHDPNDNYLFEGSNYDSYLNHSQIKHFLLLKVSDLVTILIVVMLAIFGKIGIRIDVTLALLSY